MSAWIVSKKHIDLTVKAIVEGTRDPGWPGVPGRARVLYDRLGQLLTDTCVASVSARYPRDRPGELPGPSGPGAYYLRPYVYADPVLRFSAGECYSAVRCYAYQSCEHAGWKASAARRLCDRVCLAIEKTVPAAAAHAASGEYPSKWEAFRDSPWGWCEDAAALWYALSHSAMSRALLRDYLVYPADANSLNAWLRSEGLLDRPLCAARASSLLDDLPASLLATGSALADELVLRR